MYICVDFDGTIVEHRFPAIGQPVPGAIEWMKRWRAAGAKLVLFTVRSDDHLEAAAVYVRGHGVDLHGVNVNPDQAAWSSSPKAYAAIYVDDAAFGCPMTLPEGFQRACVDWNVVGPAVLEAIQERKR